jgi:DNA end-binding protein Ku
MARAIWKGAISFGLVSIPVEVHTAVRDSRPHFRMLHAKDKSPVNFQRVCAKEGEPVAWQDLVKGYEYEKGRFVVLSKEDFETAALEKTKTVDIIDFVKAEDIDDRFFDKPYYLTPGKGGERSYALLREAIRESGRIGIAKFILREAQHLAAVEVIGDAIVLSIMRYADELVPTTEYGFPSGKDVRKQELDMARMLVENLAADWDPKKYTDDYRANLMKVIKAKVKGKEVHLEAEEEPRSAQVVDLMERLRKSLESGGARRSGTRSVAADRSPRRKTTGRKRSAA